MYEDNPISSWRVHPTRAIIGMQQIRRDIEAVADDHDDAQFRNFAGLVGKYIDLATLRHNELQTHRPPYAHDDNYDFRAAGVEGRPEDAGYIAEKVMALFGREVLVQALGGH